MTFALMAYNQQCYIAQAVEAAFKQTYSPLEIILSDDGSEDDTFGIMNKLAKMYRGPHRVVLNRNPINIGISGHVNRLVEMARGKLLILAGGDDISLPDRTSLVTQVWEASGRRASSIHSRWIGIDKYGALTGYEKRNRDIWPADHITWQRQLADPVSYVAHALPKITGATHAFSKHLYDIFGPLPENIYEDQAIAFRSVLVGEIFFINRPLVMYRRHGANTWAPLDGQSVSSRSQLRELYRQDATQSLRLDQLCECYRKDVKILVGDGRLDLAKSTELITAIDRVQRIYRLRHRLYTTKGKELIKIAFQMLQFRNHRREAISRLLPRMVSEYCSLVRRRWTRRIAKIGSVSLL